MFNSIHSNKCIGMFAAYLTSIGRSAVNNIFIPHAMKTIKCLLNDINNFIVKCDLLFVKCNSSLTNPPMGIQLQSGFSTPTLIHKPLMLLGLRGEAVGDTSVLLRTLPCCSI